MYFIDEKGGIQVLHRDLQINHIKDNDEKVKRLDHINNYYKEHIMVKIGSTDIQDKRKQRVKVTYVKNNLVYEDIKYPAKGLIEYFIQADQAFDFRD